MVCFEKYHLYENPDEMTLTKQTQNMVFNGFSIPNGAKTNSEFDILRNICFKRYPLNFEDDQRKENSTVKDSKLHHFIQL